MEFSLHGVVPQLKDFFQFVARSQNVPLFALFSHIKDFWEVPQTKTVDSQGTTYWV